MRGDSMASFAALLADALGTVVGVLSDPFIWIIALVVAALSRRYLWIFLAGASYSLGLLALDLSIGLGRPPYIVAAQFVVFCGLALLLRSSLFELKLKSRTLTNVSARADDSTKRPISLPRWLKGRAARFWLAASICWLVVSTVGLTNVWVEEGRSPFMAWELADHQPCRILTPAEVEEWERILEEEPVVRTTENEVGAQARPRGRCMDSDRYYSIQARFLTGLTLQLLGPPLALALFLFLATWVIAGFKRNAM